MAEIFSTTPAAEPGAKAGTVRYAVLGSGSSANAYIFEYLGTSLVVDNGFSCRECLRRAALAGFDPDSISLILLTHVHNDHLRGVATLSRRLKAPVALHESLPVKKWLPKGVWSRIPLVPGTILRHGPFGITPIASSHDAPCSLNYHIEAAGRRFALVTDTGKIPPPLAELAGSVDVLFLEANYDESMLIHGPYPEDIKQRILSDVGHLSNADAVDFLNTLASGKGRMPEIVFFCHLSGTNNSPEVLREYLRLHLKADVRVRVCEKGELCLPPEDETPSLNSLR